MTTNGLTSLAYMAFSMRGAGLQGAGRVRGGSWAAPADAPSDQVKHAFFGRLLCVGLHARDARMQTRILLLRLFTIYHGIRVKKKDYGHTNK